MYRLDGTIATALTDLDRIWQVLLYFWCPVTRCVSWGLECSRGRGCLGSNPQPKHV